MWFSIRRMGPLGGAQGLPVEVVMGREGGGMDGGQGSVSDRESRV